MKGPNKTYQLQHGCVLLRNAGSADPTKDGWFVDAPSRRVPISVPPEIALWLLRTKLAPRTLPA